MLFLSFESYISTPVSTDWIMEMDQFYQKTFSHLDKKSTQRQDHHKWTFAIVDHEPCPVVVVDAKL